MNPAADRLERAARLCQEMPLSDQTLAILELIGKLAVDTICTSPADQADMARLLADLMRG